MTTDCKDPGEAIARAAGYTPEFPRDWWENFGGVPGAYIGPSFYTDAECQDHLVPVLMDRRCHINQCKAGTQVYYTLFDHESSDVIIVSNGSFSEAVVAAIMATAKWDNKYE